MASVRRQAFDTKERLANDDPEQVAADTPA
jgi:hypothetical protein